MALDISQGYSREGTAAETGPVYSGFNSTTRESTPIVRRFPERRTFANRILTELPRTVMDRISGHLRPVYLRRNDYLFQAEDRIDYIYFPETAVVSEYQMLDDGRTIEIALTGSESAMGVSSVFGPCSAISWTQVCADGTALKIESELFRNIAARESAVKALFNDLLNSYIRHISQKVICNTHHSVEERLCSWLLMLSDRVGSAPLKLTQEHIARVLGVYRPSVTCIARSLKDRGLIDYVRGKIMVRDREDLIKAACACYGEFRTLHLSVNARSFSQRSVT